MKDKDDKEYCGHTELIYIGWSNVCKNCGNRVFSCWVTSEQFKTPIKFDNQWLREALREQQ